MRLSLKIVHINAVTWGSTGRNAIEMCHYMYNIGHNCFLAYSDGVAPEGIVSYKIGSKIDHKLHALFSRISGLQGYFSFIPTYRLLKWLKSLSPDIVHLHNLHANYINLGMLLKFLSKEKIATVITLHDCWFFTGKCTHYIGMNCYKWQSQCNNCPCLHMDNDSWFFDRTKKMFNDKRKLFNNLESLCVVGVSQWITNEANKSILRNAKKLTTIYNWIDLDIFRPKIANSQYLYDKYHISSGLFTVLFVSSIWKNDEKWNDFLKISAALNKEFQVVCVGRLNNDLIIPECVIHIPFIEDINELALLYSHSDIYIHLSRHDTFGKVLAEALACGTPIVAYSNTAINEIVPHDCGILVDTGDINSIIKSVLRIKDQGKINYSAKCIQYASENFSLTRNIEMYLNEYIEILQ